MLDCGILTSAPSHHRHLSRYAYTPPSFYSRLCTKGLCAKSPMYNFPRNSKNPPQLRIPENVTDHRYCPQVPVPYLLKTLPLPDPES